MRSFDTNYKRVDVMTFIYLHFLPSFFFNFIFLIPLPPFSSSFHFECKFTFFYWLFSFIGTFSLKIIRYPLKQKNEIKMKIEGPLFGMKKTFIFIQSNGFQVLWWLINLHYKHYGSNSKWTIGSRIGKIEKNWIYHREIL